MLGKARGMEHRTVTMLPTYSHGIDVRFVTYECLSAHGIPNIPQLDGGVTGT